MEQPANLSTMKLPGDKTQFTDGNITITTGPLEYHDGKHHIHEPETAKAHFSCCGELFVVKNEDGIPNVEDWYAAELLPKFQMLNLLKSATPI